MEEQTVVAVSEDVTGAGMELWRVRLQRPDGSFREHIFPKMTLDARAAEYGIDPADVDVILDVILHEPFIAHPGDPRNYADDPAAKAGHRVKTANAIGVAKKGQEAPDVPAWLFNADSVSQAREAHLLRVAYCRKNTVRIVAQKGAQAADPLDAIRAAHTPDLDLIATIADNVDRERRRLRSDHTARSDRTPRAGKDKT